MASFETFESDVSEKQFMEAAVNSLLKEGDEFCDEGEKCFDESWDECNLLKTYKCEYCTKVCKSKGGLTRHTRAKHIDKKPEKQLPSPIESKVVTELVNEAINSILKSKLYGDTGLAKLEKNIVKPTELFIKSLKEFYSDYCAKTDRDKLVEKFYKLMPDSAKMLTGLSPEISIFVINLIMVHIPDLLVAFHKRGCVSVKERELNVADCKSIERSEFGPLSYIAGYIIAKMFRKSKVSKSQTPEKAELQLLLSSMKSSNENEYIDSLPRGRLWTPCESLITIATECEKVFRKYSAGVVNEIPLNKIWSDVVTRPKVISAWDAILTDASMEKTAVTDICLETIVMLYIRVRSFSYTKDIATTFKMKEKLKFHKKALRQDLKRH